MHTRICFLVPLIILCHFLSAQQLTKPFKNEVAITSDNDNYLLGFRDRYYTNGFYLNFRHLAKRQMKKEEKAILQLELGQMIFNPSSYRIDDPEQMDRPYAGYLYGKITRTGFFKNNQLLQVGIAIGAIGKASGAELVQQTYHKLIGIYKAKGWAYQLKDELSLNVNGLYVQRLTSLGNDREADISSFQKLNIGNAFTNFSAGFLFRLGAFEKNSESVAWSSRLHKKQPDYSNTAEIFLFFQPELLYQAYNATLQGGLFLKDKGPVTSEVQPLVYQQRIGVQYAQGRFSLQVAGVYKTREGRSMRKSERYGVIGTAYRFN